MHVLVIGAGAMGILFAGYTWLAGHRHLTVLTRRLAQARAINDSGLHLKLPGEKLLHLKPQAIAAEEDDKLESQPDLSLVTVKQTQLIPVLSWIRRNINADKPVVFIMNGLGHHDYIREALPHHRVFYGVTQCGATRIGDTKAEVRGTGVTAVGSLAGGTVDSAPSFSRWREDIAPYLDVCWTNRIEQTMWKKAVINACINPLTALFQVPNGKLADFPALTQLMKQLYDELQPLIQAVWGKETPSILEEGRLWEEIIGVCHRTADNHSSTWQDIRHGRRTEIEALNGYFVKKAAQYHIDLPAHRFVRQAILALEEMKNDDER
ncbi:2-dehydropantoate 2-reductase [Caldalkalibacillus thermarum TA2.A1]|uniref:2-dehydropantoate 2-reductase n=1 Tax=Caldalkalibacillus thermarum (strain TA2.A1) TaxID=986075 RepID=A0A8X8I7Y7_CALTT|nr:2-dehydropantoate 2-reductase [Caldalkalibacillus thermarum TA2.A1]